MRRASDAATAQAGQRLAAMVAAVSRLEVAQAEQDRLASAKESHHRAEEAAMIRSHQVGLSRNHV